MDSIFRLIKKILPVSLFKLLQPIYHYKLALFGAILYRFPSKKLFVIGITGTKGKSSTAEIVNGILEEAGLQTALASTIRFKSNNDSKRNLFKMTMPGRFFMQRFLRDSIKNGCTHVVIEMTSEGVKQFRHKFIYLDALIFTNISPEHIESHGSFENYLSAKLQIAKELEKSKKREKIIVVNNDNEYGKKFLDIDIENKIPFSINDAEIKSISPISFTYKNVEYNSLLEGRFNIYNILSAIVLAEQMGIDSDVIKRGISKVNIIPGRVEYVRAGQNFSVVVDYAHTKDSLEKLYEIFKDKKTVCVLGNTGGGRDKWKRPEMGAVAEKYCEKVILTNEDPYDEDPESILIDMTKGMKNSHEIILDRRIAIAKSLEYANEYGEHGVVLITGKGTDPYIMESGGKKTPWDDRKVVAEEIKIFLQK